VWAPEWRALTVGLLVMVTLVASEALAVATVLPLVARDLDGLSLYGWVISAFFLGTLVGLVVGGEEVDRRGPATPFVVALVLFAAGLLIAGLAPAMWVVVAGRALQGLGAGAIPAISYASIGREIPDQLRPRVFALLSRRRGSCPGSSGLAWRLPSRPRSVGGRSSSGCCRWLWSPGSRPTGRFGGSARAPRQWR
jgi:MFS family permease